MLHEIDVFGNFANCLPFRGYESDWPPSYFVLKNHTFFNVVLTVWFNIDVSLFVTCLYLTDVFNRCIVTGIIELCILIRVENINPIFLHLT